MHKKSYCPQDQPPPRPISGARALDQCGEDAIAGLRTLLVGVRTAAQGRTAEACELREGYAQGILSGRGTADEVGYDKPTAPRKIPRDSPAALPRAQKKMMRSAGRLVFGTVTFLHHHFKALNCSVWGRGYA